MEKKEESNPYPIKLGRFGSLHWAHWLIIVLSLLLTFFAWYASSVQVDEKKAYQFDEEASQVTELIKERMTNYEDALWGGVALIRANNSKVGYLKWKTYVNNLGIVDRYPGVNGLGIIYFVQKNDLNRHLEYERKIRPNYKVHPAHKNEIYLPITYIIPVKGNEKAVGLDMAHEKNRYTAAIKARDTGTSQITGPIILVQDNENTPGFLFYAPFYKDGKNKTKQERIENFLGLVYEPFIMKKMMRGVLSKQKRKVLVKIKDGDVVLFSDEDQEISKKYNRIRKLKLYGREWQISISATKGFSESLESNQPYTILFGGILIDVLLLFLFITISRSNKRAIHYAKLMTKELKGKNNKLELLNDSLEKTKKDLEILAHYDSITKLPNRFSFKERLNELIRDAKKERKMLAVCYIDLDNFKIINDSFGHGLGDELLKEVSKAMQSLLREGNYLAHLGGDEFGLILNGVNSSELISRIVKEYVGISSKTFKVGHNKIKTTFSIGIAMYPAAGETPGILIKNANIAMYKAKEKGKNTFVFYDEDISKQKKRRQDVESLLKKAVENKELFLVYQPQICIESKKIYGVEALLRWHNDVLGDVSPEEFIPIAEETGVIGDIGTWVLQQVVWDIEALRKINEKLEVSINVSVRQLEQDGFYDDLICLFKVNNLSPKGITLEVTETAIMQNPKQIIGTMKQLNDFGVSFSLDDFGTGYSSMSYLKQLPISSIKIDQSFVKDIEKDPSDAVIVKSIIRLSNALNTKSVAEGVETYEAYKFLKEQGCNYVQGFYFDKPLSLTELLNKYQKQG